MSYSHVRITQQARNFPGFLWSFWANFAYVLGQISPRFLAIFCNFLPKFGKKKAKFAQKILAC